MLPTCAPETLQCIACHIVATLDRNFFDCIGHVFNGYPQKSFGKLMGALLWLTCFLRNAFCKRFEFLFDNRHIKGFIRVRTKDRREMGRVQFSKHHIAICDGQWPTATIACRSRIGPCTFGSDLKPTVTVKQDRSPAGSNRVNVHHRRA